MALVIEESFNLGIPTKASLGGDIDPYANNTVALLHMDGVVDASTTFTDSGPYNLTPTVYGVTKNSIARSKFGSGSILFASSSLVVAPNAALDFSTGDFTVEAWINFTVQPTSDSWPSGAAAMSTIYGRGTASTANGWSLFYGANNISMQSNDVTIVTGAHGMQINNWYHVALTRYGNIFSVFVNGVLVGSATAAITLGTGANYYIGSETSQTSWLQGYMDELRVTKDVARYTSNFSVPTSAFPNSSGSDPYYSTVGLLLHATGANGSTTFTDPTGNTWTPSNVTVSTAQLNGNLPVASFSGATNSYLSTPTSTNWDFGTGDFTIETWVYIETDSTTDGSGMRRAGIAGPNIGSGLDTTFWGLLIDGDATTTGTGLLFETKLSGVSASRYIVTTISKNAWHHIAISKNSNGTYFCVDGTIYITAPITQAINNVSASGINIGRESSTITWERPLNGYMSEFRITKGVARYTPGNMGALYDPYYSNVSVLLHANGANAATTIPDSSATPKTFTASGNAALSTTQSKFGVSSIYFDGSGDYISAPDNNDFDLGSVFTLECWVNFASIPSAGNQATFIMRWDGGLSKRAYFFLLDNASGTPKLSFGVSPDGTSGSAASANADWNPTTGVWYHVAAVHTGTTLMTFVDGSLIASTASTISTFNTDIGLTIGGWSGGAGGYLNGYIDEIRVSKGVARYTTTFTPATVEFPGLISNPTVSLLHFNGANNSTTFSDDTSKVWTRTGAPVISTTQSKFGGSSGYFSTGNYITTPNHSDFDLGTRAFTLELWYYIPSGSTFVSGQLSLVCAGRQDVSAGGGGWDFHGYVNYSNRSTNPILQYRLEKCLTTGTAFNYVFDTDAKLTYDAWHHVALVRDNFGSTSVFHDGVRIGNTAKFNNVALPVPNNLSIMVGSGGSVATPNYWPFTGYIDELRLVKGLALYDVDFTPSTSAYSLQSGNGSYTTPSSIPNSYLTTFGTTNVSSGTLTPTFNATYNAIDLTATTAVLAIYNLTSVPSTLKGEMEIDIEAVTAADVNWYAGLWAMTIGNTGAGAATTNGFVFHHNTYGWNSNMYLNGATYGAGVAVMQSFKTVGDVPTAFDVAGDRRIISISWDGTQTVTGNNPSMNIIMRLDGKIIFAGRLMGWKWAMHPGIYAQTSAPRLHGVRMWDAPRFPVSATSDYGYLDKLSRTTTSGGSPTVVAQNYGYLDSVKRTIYGAAIALSTFGYTKDNFMRWLTPNATAATSLSVKTGIGMPATIGMREMIYWPNNAVIKGTVKVHGTPDYPVVRQVQLFDEAVKANTMFALSDRITGEYVFNNVDPTRRYTVFAWDEFSRTYKAVISDYQIATAQSSLHNNSTLRLSGVKTTLLAANALQSNNLVPGVGLSEPFIDTGASVILHGDYLIDSGPNRLYVYKHSQEYQLANYPKFGNRSLKSNPSSLKVAGKNGVFDFGTGNFSIEFNIWINSFTSDSGVLQYGGWGASKNGVRWDRPISWLIYMNSSTLYFYGSSDGINWNIASALVIKASPATGMWHHVCVMRQSGTIYTLFNGVQQNTVASAASFNVPTSDYTILNVGSGADNWNPIDCWVDEVIITKGTNKTQKNFTLATSEYAPDLSTILLLHANGTNGSTTITDSSLTPKTVTAFGTAAISTAQSKFGGSSLLIPGTTTGNYFSAGSSTDYIANKPLTVDFWFYLSAYNASGGRMLCAGGGGGGVWNATNGIHWLLQSSSNGIGFQYWDGAQKAGAVVASLNTWHHCALVFDPSIGRADLWLNGVLVWNNNNVNTITPPSTTPTLMIGAIPGEGATATQAFTGYIDEVRISQGINFESYFNRKTPYIGFDRLTGVDSANVELLIHGNTLADVSGNAVALTNVGTTIDNNNLVLGQPSIYFDGTDYIKASNTAGLFDVTTGDFTVEFWAYATATTGKNCLIGSFDNAYTEANGWRLEATYTAGGGYELRFINHGGASIASTKIFTINQWDHIAVSKASNVLRLFVDGEMVASVAHTNAVSMGNFITIGSGSSTNFNNDAFQGNISELRYTKTGRYTSNFSVEYLPFL